ncbi:MAG: alpha/beta fold hydrolase [Mycobacteriaceae bacterium]|nr:alpha/beta fold hydrolase [Mycobacteriaceae bacterium]
MLRRCVAAVAAVAAGLVAVAPAAAAPADPLARFSGQHLDWKSCGNKDLDPAGARCAEVTVPLDYADPAGRTLAVAISRIPATDARHRRGILLFNPGGPGAGGLAMPARPNALAPEVRSRYDLIGFDPRGVGRSAPVNCGWKPPTAMMSAGFDQTGFARDAVYFGGVAASCLAVDGARIRHITTRNTARDMDLIRAVLGERTLNYYGVSYGTYLGTVYLQMFGDRADRVLLDSAMDPDATGVGYMGMANEIALDDWARWVSAHDGEYHLGATVPAVRATLAELQRKVARRPMPWQNFFLDEHQLPPLLFAFVRDFRVNDLLAKAIRQIAVTPDGAPLRVDGPVQDFLIGQMALDNPAFFAVSCGDHEFPHDPQWYWRDIESHRATEPVFGPMVRSVSPCAWWPAPTESPTAVGNSRPVLITQSTMDTRTPYHGAVALHHKLTGSRLVTLRDVRIHGAFRPGLSRCLNDTVNAYFRTGALPPSDRTCTL